MDMATMGYVFTGSLVGFFVVFALAGVAVAYFDGKIKRAH